jgi:hypothetical protein
MRTRVFTSIAICALALGLTGCRVQSVLVVPPPTPYAYAAPGQILEWRPYDRQAIFYVIFDGHSSPCAKAYYQVGPDKPARCKVLKDQNGYFSYHFSNDPPPPDPSTPPSGQPRSKAKSCRYCDVGPTPKPPPPPGRTPRVFLAKSCPYCTVAIGPIAGNGAAPIRDGEGDDTGDNYSLRASCVSGVAEVDSRPIQDGVQNGDQISWIPLKPSNTVTITMHAKICNGGPAGPFTTNQVCTISGPPTESGQTPIPYTYDVVLDNCRQGSGNITINPPPPAQ